MQQISSTQIQHALFMFTRKFKSYQNVKYLTRQTYSNALPFVQMLTAIPFFEQITKEIIDKFQSNPKNSKCLNQINDKPRIKLNNFKKLLLKMGEYIEIELQKSLKTNDIELMDIVKNNSLQDLLKIFEIVIAVLMQTPQKQSYIQKIMQLDERSQQALVIVVQNAMEHRIIDFSSSQNNFSSMSSQKLFIKLESVENENIILREQINELCQQNEYLIKNNQQLKDKMHLYEQEIQKAKSFNMQMYMSAVSMNMNGDEDEKSKQNTVLEKLKSKMISMAGQHQMEIGKLNEQIDLLKNKLYQIQSLDDEQKDREKALNEKIRATSEIIQAERKKSEQRQIKMKKLEYQLEISKKKIRELNENLELNDINLRMELQKKQIRFKQLQKQVKSTKILESSYLDNNQHHINISSRKSIPQPLIHSIQKGKTSSKQQKQLLQKQKQKQKQQQQYEYMKIQVQKLRSENRCFEKQILKLKKNVDKITVVQNQKKKLEKIILDVSKSKDSQIEMLVVSMYELRCENVKMYELIQQMKKEVIKKCQRKLID